jgi:hypothetical protein
MPVEPWEKRYISIEGQREKGVLLCQRTADDANCWYGMTGGGAFGRVNLRKYHSVRRDPVGAPGEYDDVTVPDEAEKGAILERLEIFKQSGGGGSVENALLGVGRAAPLPVPPPGTGPGYVRGDGLDPRLQAILPGQDRRPRNGRPQDRRPGRYRRFVQTARNVGPARVAAGGAFSFGFFFKVYGFIHLHWDSIEIFLGKYQGTGGKIDKFIHFASKAIELGRDGSEWVTYLGGIACDEWDSVLILIFGSYFLIKYSAGAASPKDEAERDRASEEAAERRHREYMDAQRRMHEDNQLQANRLPTEQAWEPIGRPPAGGRDWGAELARRADVMSQQLEKDHGAGPSAEGKKKTVSVLERVRRLLRRAKNPLERAIFLISRFVVMSNWSLPEEFQERLAADHMAITFNNGTARARSLTWIRDHGLDKCKAAAVHTALADIIDAACLDDDDPDLINREWFERIMRWQYGLEKVFEHCSTEADYKSAKPKTRWGLLEEYHVSAKNLGQTRAPGADLAVQGNLQQKARFLKHLEKVGIKAGHE